MKLRMAVEADLKNLDTVFRDSIGKLCANDYSTEIISEWINSVPVNVRKTAIEKGVLWVAEIESRIAGYSVSVPGEIVALFVHPKFSGQGVGRALGQHAFEQAKIGNPEKIIVESTTTAQPFYSKLGFVPVSTGWFSHGGSELKIEVVNMEYMPSIS